MLFANAVPGLILIAIIFFGVRSGVFTASESSNIAVVYALLVTLLVYRSLSFHDFVEATKAAVRTTAMVLLVIGCAASFGWLLAFLKVPTALVTALQGLSDNPIVILLLINVVLLVLGTFMDMSPLIVITTPIFLPVAQAFGVDPVHFGGDPCAQPRDRAMHAAGWGRIVCRLRGRTGSDMVGDAHDLAVLRRRLRDLDAGHLYPRAVALAARTIPLNT